MGWICGWIGKCTVWMFLLPHVLMVGWRSDLCHRREASPGLGIGLVMMMIAIAIEFPSKVWLGCVTRHQVSRDCRCAESPLPSLGYSHRTSSSEAVPAKAPKASQGPKGLPRPQRPLRPERTPSPPKALKAPGGLPRPHKSCPLKGNRGPTRRRGKWGSSKRFVSKVVNPYHHWRPWSDKRGFL